MKIYLESENFGVVCEVEREGSLFVPGKAKRAWFMRGSGEKTGFSNHTHIPHAHTHGKQGSALTHTHFMRAHTHTHTHRLSGLALGSDPC